MAELVEDPVCHMKVDPAKARATAEHQGKTYYFCCPGCAQKFQAEPASYLAPAAGGAGLVQLGMAKTGGAQSHGPAHSGLINLGVPASAPAKDPVCGMSVNPASAKYRTEHRGQAIYFCSPSCQQKFQAQPDKYLHPPAASVDEAPLRVGPSQAKPAVAPAPSPAGAAVYTCPMDPEVRQSHPGACPKCGMDLEPEVVAPTAVKIEYTCPMHPEI
ncbi:MAG: YHS domain-containing protein, partial [Chlamydiota bacterium]